VSEATLPPGPDRASHTSPRAAASARLSALKSRPRKPGEASFFWYEAQLRNEAVKVLPGEYFVCAEDILIMTTLGSCIAACLWDRHAKLGGMNHFMLPDGGGEAGSGSLGGRYGSFAMERLINEMLKLGARRTSIEAKVFGGGQVISGMHSMNIGERNTAFVLDYLKAERIPIVSQDVRDIHPRKVCFLPASGKAMVKRLASTNHQALIDQERSALRSIDTAAAGSVELF
jgi:chemotaxis protein CheD